MSLHSDLYESAFQFGNQVEQVEQGEEAQFVLLTMDKATKTLVEHKTVAGQMRSADVRNNLPPDVLFELMLPESAMVQADVKKVYAVRHALANAIYTYKIKTPSPIEPYGTYRYWRLWLVPMESTPNA
jgi:hypothetical protein